MREACTGGERIRPRLTYANVVSTLCLFLILGGAAVAALKLPKNSVGTRQIKKNAVNGSKVADRSLTAVDVNGPVDSASEAAHAAEAGHALSADQLGGLGPASFFPSGNVKRGEVGQFQDLNGSRTDPLLTIGPLTLTVTCATDGAGNTTLTFNASSSASDVSVWWSYNSYSTFDPAAVPHTGGQPLTGSPTALFSAGPNSYSEIGAGQLYYHDPAVDIVLPFRYQDLGIANRCGANVLGLST